MRFLSIANHKPATHLVAQTPSSQVLGAPSAVGSGPRWSCINDVFPWGRQARDVGGTVDTTSEPYGGNTTNTVRSENRRLSMIVYDVRLKLPDHWCNKFRPLTQSGSVINKLRYRIHANRTLLIGSQLQRASEPLLHPPKSRNMCRTCHGRCAICGVRDTNVRHKSDFFFYFDHNLVNFRSHAIAQPCP